MNTTAAKRSPLISFASGVFYHAAKILGQSTGARILCYHRVHDAEQGYMSVPVEKFRNQMRWLAEKGYRTVSLTDLLQAKADEKSVVMTFDDGYEDNYEKAFPVMRGHGFYATIFLIAQRIGEPSYLKISQIQEMLRAGFEFGSHTLSHPNLKNLSREEKRREISDSKIAIERLLGTNCDFFCYPFGHFDEESVNIVKDSGYRGACSNAPGGNREISNPFLLRRTEVAPYDSPEDLKKKMAGAYDLLHTALHQLRGRP